MPVPEAPVSKYHRLMAGEDNIGTPGQTPCVQAETEACSVQPATKYQFRPGIYAPDAGHHPAANGR